MSNIFRSNWKHFFCLVFTFLKNLFTEPYFPFVCAVSFLLLFLHVWQRCFEIPRLVRCDTNRGWLLRGTGREETRQEGRKADRKVQKLVILAWESCRIAFLLYQYFQGLTVKKCRCLICGYSKQWQIEEVKKCQGKPVRADFLKNLKYVDWSWTFVDLRVIIMISHMLLLSAAWFLNVVQ